MAAGKNQHYVPQRYFRMFSEDGKSIRTLKLSDGSIIPSASIKGQSSKAWFYGTSDVEERLAQLENLTGKSLREISTCTDTASLSLDTLEHFRTWLAVQRTRTESSRQASKGTDTNLTKLWLEAAINSNAEIDEARREDLLSVLPMVETVDSTFQLQRMAIAAEHSYKLADLDIVLVKNLSGKPFIFGDAPCIYCNPLRQDINYKGVLGMSSLGLIIAFPLNHQLMALLYDGLVYNVRKPSTGIRTTNLASDITSLNKLQFHAASSCIYYSNARHDSYISYLWNLEKNNFTGKNYINVETEPVAKGDGTTSSIFHIYEPQLPVRLNLSFLSIKNRPFPEEIDTRDEYRYYIR